MERSLDSIFHTTVSIPLLHQHPEADVIYNQKERDCDYGHSKSHDVESYFLLLLSDLVVLIM